MRKPWLSLFAVLLGLVVCPQVGAQSLSDAELNDISDKMIASAVRDMPAHSHAAMAQSGCTGYVANQPQYSLFMPSDWAAQGGVVVTANMSASGATGTFHKGTFGVGTQVTVNWLGQNISLPMKIYYQWDNSGWVLWYTLTAAGGNLQFTTTSAMIGHNIQIKLDGAGSSDSSQDIDTYTVVNQPAGTYDYDELPTNLIQVGQFSFAVPPMNQACQQCIDFPSSCLGANHTPYITATLKNVNSGETKSVSHAVAGNDFNEQENGYGSWTAGISVLPGDGPEPDPSDPPTGEIFCFAVGADIFNQKQSGDNYTWIVAKTKIKVAQQGSTTAGVTRWYVDSWCKDTQHVPIWEPIYIDTAGGITPLIKVGQYELSEQDCYAEPGWPEWKCLPITVTPPQPLHIGVGGTKYDCSTVLNTPLPK